MEFRLQVTSQLGFFMAMSSAHTLALAPVLPLMATVLASVLAPPMSLHKSELERRGPRLT